MTDRRAEARMRSKELEIACEFGPAARAADEAGDLARAIRLASLATDIELVDELVDKVEDAVDQKRIASDLLHRGHARAAGRLLLKAGEADGAAAAFERAALPLEAARAFERASRPAEAARVLEAALLISDDRHELRLELARLLARHGKQRAAVRAVQALPRGTPERAAALPLLARLFKGLGLSEAEAETRAEMRRRGIEEDAEGDHVEAPTEAIGTIVLGRYEVVNEIAVSATARLLEARDRVLDRAVALKALRPVLSSSGASGRDVLRRFEREARALESLRHPAIVSLFDYHPEGPAIVMEWMAGGSLADLMKTSEIAPARAVEIAAAMLNALGEAHRLGILHRDVKPSNILFDAIGAPKLSDFGAAHLSDQANTATAGAIGTFSYMSPEQRLGQPATATSDVYAVGAVLWELLTGRPAIPTGAPKRDANDAEVDGQPDVVLSDVHPELTPAHGDVVRRLLAHDPEDRPKTAFEARTLLTSLPWPATLSPEGSRPAPRSSRPPPLSDKHPGRLAAWVDDGTDGRDLEQMLLDTWFNRPVIVLAAAEIARARQFARAGHPCLPVVLRLDAAEGGPWVAPPRGTALADEPRAVPERAWLRLEAALDALDAQGGHHGCIDAQHLYWHDGALTLAYPRRSVAHHGQSDKQALRRLSGRASSA